MLQAVRSARSARSARRARGACEKICKQAKKKSYPKEARPRINSTNLKRIFAKYVV